MKAESEITTKTGARLGAGSTKAVANPPTRYEVS